MAGGLVLHTVNERVATVILNRAEKRNALSPALVSELKSTLRDLERNDDVKVIVLKAAGEAFCAGADLDYLRSLQSNTFEENLADSNHLRELFSMIYNLEKVVIAQVEGPAIAGGCGLATICDIVFCTPAAKFGYTEVNIGFIPAIVSKFLLRKCGETIARELFLSGRIISAEEAAEKRLVNFVVSPENIEREVRAYAERLCVKTSGTSLAITKKLLARVQDLPLEQALTEAAEMNAAVRATPDCKKGIAAFLDKQKLDW